MKTERSAVRCAFVVCCLLILGVLTVPAHAQTSTVWVTMPDGVNLRTYLFEPQSGGPSWPVVLIRTPLNWQLHHMPPSFFTDNGYYVVIQSCRGTGESGGVFWMYLDDPGDGHSTIEWIAQQPWCNGNIGMVGISSLGATQYAVMQDAPPALKCLAPERASPDGYHTVFFQGGAFREEFALFLCSFYGIPDFCDEALLHRLLDSWWDPWVVLDEPDRVHVPILHIDGWYEMTQQGQLDGYAVLQHAGGAGAAGNQYLIVDPMDHVYEFGALPLPPERFARGDSQYYPQHTLAWLDYWLKGEPSGVDQWPAAHVYLMGACEEPGAPGCHWVDLENWPPSDHWPKSFYLAADGTLSTTVPVAGELVLPIDPLDPVPTYGGANAFNTLMGPYDQAANPASRPIESRADVLVFSTEVLAEPVEVMGRVTARIWIRPDTLDLDLSVRLTDVYPDGRSMLIIDGIQRARMRCGDDRECFMIPGEVYEIEVDLWSTAMVFNAGHRIRVAIAGTNYDRFERNDNSGGDLNNPQYQVAHPDILFGPQYPTAIYLPLPALFADGFESGNTSAWSSAVP